MITGDLEPTFGNAYQEGQDVVTSRSKYQTQIGYCPQFDPLLDKMTGREMLKLFGRLRGVKPENLGVVVNQLIDMADLSKHADKTTESYSGGNKRKLSLALSLIANPKVILLDEPTAGVDPVARKKIWTLLSFIRKAYDCSIVLTSHSMHECETLCSRLGIMVSGLMRCLGSAQQLRAKYGRGYTIMIKLKRDNLNSSEYVTSLWRHIENVISGVVLADQHETICTLRVPEKKTKWSTLFEIMEDTKCQFQLEDYTISDTTLEQIFISFARTN
jgi:ATP-binding cassette subfamily A (ABC1) protein 3